MVLSVCRWLLAAISFFLYNHDEQKNFLFITHPFYITVTEINHNAKEEIVEISCKMFTDDLETALKKSAGAKIDMPTQNNKSATDKLIAAYITKHLQLKVDGEPVILQFIGSEKEAEATWSYFQVNHISSLKKLEIDNDLLYESFDDEVNLVHVMVNGNRQSKKLNRPDRHLVFEF